MPLLYEMGTRHVGMALFIFFLKLRHDLILFYFLGGCVLHTINLFYFYVMVTSLKVSYFSSTFGIVML